LSEFTHSFSFTPSSGLYCGVKAHFKHSFKLYTDTFWYGCGFIHKQKVLDTDFIAEIPYLVSLRFSLIIRDIKCLVVTNLK